MSLNILDIVFLGLIASFTLISIMRGALRELLSLVGLVGGFFLAHWFYPQVALQLEPILPDPALAELVSYLAILLGGYFTGIFLGGLGEAFRPQHGDLLNRTAGGLIGALKGTTVSLVLYWLILSYIPPFQDELGESLVGRELGRLFSLMESFNLI